MKYLNALFYKFFRFYLKFLGFFYPCPFGKELQKYWNTRQYIFSRFDEGIQIDAEGLHSAVREASALKIADFFRVLSVIDAFCGTGSMSIALAKTAKKVIAIELNSSRLEMAKHNAKIYGVREKIEFVSGNALELIPGITADAIFLDPPWGGPEYVKKLKFKFKDFSIDIEKVLPYCLDNFRITALKIPKNFDIEEINKFQRKYIVEDSYFLGKLSFKTIFFKNA